MTTEINHQTVPRQRWRVPSFGPGAIALSVLSVSTLALLMFTSPADNIQRLYGTIAILAGVLAGQSVHAAISVSRLAGHVTETVSGGVEAVVGVVGDVLEVNECLTERHIGEVAGKVETLGSVHPITAPSRRRSVAWGSEYYLDPVEQQYRPLADLDEALADVFPLRSNVS